MKKIAFIILAAFTLFSCTKEDIQETDTSTGKVQLILQTGDFTQIQTRAVAEAQIKDIIVLEFKSGTLVKKRLLEDMDFTKALTLDFLEPIPAATTQTVTDAYGYESTVLIENGQENLVYILANVKAVTGQEVALNENVSTFADLKALGFDSGDLTNVLPMVGYYYGGVHEGATTQINVTLIRTVAKITFTLNTTNFMENGMSPNVTVKSITLCNIPTDITPYPCANRPTLPANGMPGVWPNEMTPFPKYNAEKFTNYGIDKNNSTTPTTSYVTYIPENARGSFASITNNKMKVPTNDQKGWSYLMVDLNYSFSSGITKNATYKIYLGGDNAGDINLLRNTNYNITTYLYGANTADTRITVTPLFDPETGLQPGDLNIQKNANSYIINPASIPAKYTIPLTQARLGWNYIKASEGNEQLLTDFDNLIKGDNWEIITLWKSWSDNKSITGSKANVTFKDGGGEGEANYFATLLFPDDIAAGNNAVIALVDKSNSDKIYWSWHLWFTDYNPDATGENIHGQTHSYFGASFLAGGKYVGKKMMDRNLGAVITKLTNKTAISQPQSTDEAIKYYGLMYQFGRKDPFVGSGNGGSTSFVPIYNAAGTLISDNVVNTPTGSNLSNSVQSPTSFYTASGNWTTPSEDLWSAASGKSPFDPCPAGWRVPQGGTAAANNPWAGFGNDNPDFITNANYTGSYFDWLKAYENNSGTAGRTYRKDDTQAWYPASGSRNSETGKLSNVALIGYCWSATVAGTPTGYYFSYNSSTVNPVNNYFRAYGFPVRCVQE